MPSVKKQDAAVMMYPLNAAAQDVANEFSLTKGRVASEKISAALSALNVRAVMPRSTSFAKIASPVASRSASLSMSFGSMKSSMAFSSSPAPRLASHIGSYGRASLAPRPPMGAASPSFFGMKLAA